MTEGELRREALRNCYLEYLLKDEGDQDLVDAVQQLSREFPKVEVVLRVVARLEPSGRNIYPPKRWEFGPEDILDMDDGEEAVML